MNGTTTTTTRYGPAVLALVAFVVTFAAVLFYGLADRVDPAVEQAEAEPLERGGAEAEEPAEDLAATVVRLGLEVAIAREEAALAREAVALAHDEAVAAHEQVVALAERLVAAERRNEELIARQEAFESALAAAAQQPPRVTVRVPEPAVEVHTAEPEVTVEAPGAGRTPEARVEVERAEPRVTIERPERRTEGQQEALAAPGRPPAAAAGDLVGSDVVNSRGETIARVADVVRRRDGGEALYLVVALGGGGGAGGAETKRVVVAWDAFDRGPGGDELILPPAIERELAAMPPYREDDFERPSQPDR